MTAFRRGVGLVGLGIWAIGCGVMGGTTLALPLAPQGMGLRTPMLAWPLVQASDAVLDRWPTCDLSGWTVEVTKGFVPQRGGEPTPLLGVTPDRRIQLSDQIPRARLQPVVRWELCNACRQMVTGQRRDRGCQ